VCPVPDEDVLEKGRLRKGNRGGAPPRFDAQAYKGRNVVGRAINRLKDFRAVATRYEKRGHNFLAAVIVATIILWRSEFSQIDVVHPIGDVGACIASGSFRTMGMLVAPCSMRTVGEIASGVTSSLLTRSADVVLKGRLPLALMARETPLNLIHLRTAAFTGPVRVCRCL
jgi:3-polyprenyl-4-hydroxybenzoate decarboxylase